MSEDDRKTSSLESCIALTRHRSPAGNRIANRAQTELDEIIRELAIWRETASEAVRVVAERKESDRAEFNLVSAVRSLGGVASLDQIIVHLYTTTKEVQKRMPLSQRLYRMTQKELLHSVPGKKGVYSVAPMTEEEAAKLI